MSKVLKSISLADKISDLLTTKPQYSDDDEEESHPKLTEKIEEADADEENQPSTFRKRNAALLEDLDERYAGKKSSRKKLGHIATDDTYEDTELSLINFEESDGIDSDSESEAIDQDSDSGQEQSKLEGDEDDGLEESGEQEDDQFQHFDESKSKDSSKNKGQCVRNQLLIWESLLEMRIQFQKCLIAANKMPLEDTYSNISNCDSDFSIKVFETKDTILATLNKLLELQSVVSRQFPETKNVFNADLNVKRKTSAEKLVEDDINEEIPSDTDQESESEPDIESNHIKKPKLDLKVELNKRHSQYTEYRNSVIQKWNDKTRLAVSKSASNSHSVVKQIEHNLSDRIRLIGKTQLKRSQYSIMGESHQQSDDSKKDEQTANSEEYNGNIFDDDDFYHHLLRELIEVKSADLTDPVQLGRQWIQLQNLRSKMKRKIDTKATKGRKIRIQLQRCHSHGGVKSMLIARRDLTLGSAGLASRGDIARLNTLRYWHRISNRFLSDTTALHDITMEVNQNVQDHRNLVDWSSVENGTDLPIDMRFNDGHRLSIIGYSILMVFSAIGNISVLVLILRRRRKMPSRINTALMHLAIADLLVTFLMMPLEIVWAYTVSWWAGDAMCRIMAFFRMFGLYLSSYILVCISLDRYYAVLKPLHLNGVDRRGKFMLTVAWMGATVCSLPQMLIFQVETHPGVSTYDQCITYNALPSYTHQIIYAAFGCLMMYVFPLCIIIYTYAAILMEIYRRTRDTNGVDRIRRSSLGFLGRAKIRTLKMTIIIVLVFFVCWTPYNVMMLWYWYDRETAIHVDQRIQKGLFLFACTNSCMNPIVYGAFNIRARRPTAAATTAGGQVSGCLRAPRFTLSHQNNNSQCQSRNSGLVATDVGGTGVISVPTTPILVVTPTVNGNSTRLNVLELSLKALE